MATPQITVRIAADNQTSAVLAGVQARVRELGVSGGVAGQGMSRSFNEAKGAAALLGHEVGINLNRHLRSVLASSQLIGPLLEAAFPVAAAIGFIEIARQIPDAIQRAANAVAGYGEELQKAYDKTIKSNEAAITHFKTVAAGYAQLQYFRKQASGSSQRADAFNDPFFGVGEALATGGILGASTTLYSNIKGFNEAIADSVTNEETMGKIIEHITELTKENTKQAAEAAKKLAEEMKKAFAEIEKGAGLSGKRVFDVATPRDWRNLLPIDQGALVGLGPLQNVTPDPKIADQYLDRFKALRQIFEDTRTPAERLVIEMQKLNLLFGDDKSSELYRRALEQIKQRFDESHQAALQFGNAVGEALKEGLLMGRSWDDVMKSLLITIAQLIVKMYVLKALQASSFGSSGFGSILGSLLTGFTGMHAGGGYMAPGQWGIVGESGPELAFAGQAGMSIIPASRGGGSRVQYFDMRGSIVTDDVVRKAELAGAMRLTESRALTGAVATIREDQLRGRGWGRS